MGASHGAASLQVCRCSTDSRSFARRSARPTRWSRQTAVSTAPAPRHRTDCPLGSGAGHRREGSPVMGAEPQLSERFAYDFDDRCEGGRALLGGKGLGLAEMTQLGLPVPRGFTITTAACVHTMREGREPASLAAEVDLHLARLEQLTGKRFGDGRQPLLLSVRSGGPVSMPGMMETVLNLGLSRRVAEAFARTTGNRRFAFDAYRRLIQMYGEVVAGIEADVFAAALAALKDERGIELDSQLSGPRLRPARRHVRRALPRCDRRGLPPGSARAARCCDPRGLRLVERAARPGLPPRIPHLGRARNRRERDGDGVRQPRCSVGDGCLLQPQPGDRAAGAVRRVPRRRPG